MNNQEIANGSKLALLVSFILFLHFGGCENSTTNNINTERQRNCYDRVSQYLIEREGNKIVSQSDVERYSNEFKSRCN